MPEEKKESAEHERLLLYHDSDRCIGCYSCELLCKMKNNLPVGPRLCRMVELEPKVRNNTLRTEFHFLPCFQCEKAACMHVCPTGAVQRRLKDGIVYIDPKLCIGCRCCISACPWGVPQWNPETGKAVKCDYCRDRLDQGLKPACVTGCLTQCLHLEDPGDTSEMRRRRFAESVEKGNTIGKKVQVL